MEFPRHAVAADLVVLTITDGRLQVALVERGIPPFEGRWALPGGFVLDNESVAAAAQRELAEEAGLSLAPTHLEQLATFGEVGRDPRGRVISVTYLAFVASLGGVEPGSDASGASWWPVNEVPPLAFDHDAILRAGLERARAKLEYTTMATRFCPEQFTMAELRGVYEAAWATALDPRNFARKVLGSPGFVVECGTRSGTRGRPAALYRAGDAVSLHPPILREASA
ncbi:MAG: NUDIX domain-containing protein [Propionibacteriaceae bacterium]|nr:NUDIX domain-containing protein [Propionibacteriaceae bacterium]